QAVHDRESFGPTLRDGLRFITFLTVPAGLALWLLAAPAVDVVYNWRSLMGGAMDPVLRQFTVAATAPLGLAVFPLGVFNLLIRTFYIRANVRTPVLVVLVSLLLQAGLYLVLAPRLGIAGVSWAVAAGAYVQFVAAALLVERTERFGLRGFIGYALTVWAAAIVAVAAAAGVLALLPADLGWYAQLGRLALGGVVVVIVYALGCSALRLPEMDDLLRRFTRRG
ncbi:MAG TPA: lipid II flippase MurJ, partial [Trueperaceae bacterium]|nr:lipid II flippase MurJ [Trueperaceae bacterium]